MKNLEAEMVRFGVTKSDIRRVLNCSDKTVDNKLSGATDFTVPEALKIRNAFFEGFRIDYLFALPPDQLSQPWCECVKGGEKHDTVQRIN